jgi:hypothetical protein
VVRARLALVAALTLAVASLAAAQSPTRDISVGDMRSEKRVALVIGNADYSFAPLRNPVNDARAIAQTLRATGFDVILRENADERAMKRAINEFGDKLRGGGVGVMFFAGHGVQVGGRNYLVPIGAEIRTEADVDIETIDVQRVLARMEDARNRLNIVILDACRDNPFGRSLRSASRGLASIDAPSGTLLAFATAPGRVARDGDGANRLYTGELLAAMREPGMTLESMFKRVRQAVRQKSNGEQIPWESSSIEGDFIFSLAGPPPPTATAPRPAGRFQVRQEARVREGTLAVSARVAGVDVWLGDENVGQTVAGRVLVIESVPEGTYRLQGRKAGYQTWEREIRVTADQRAELTIDIEPLRPVAPSPAALFEEDFISRKWLAEGRETSCDTRYGDGGVYIENLSDKGTCEWWFGPTLPDRVRIELTVKLIRSKENHGFGIRFAGQAGFDHPYHVFEVADEGDVLISRWDPVTKKWTELMPWKKASPAVRGRGAVNRLAVEVDGTTIRGYVNGTLVGSAVSRAPMDGRIGFVIEAKGTQVRFSHMKATELP